MKIKIIIPINNSDFNDEIAQAVEPVLTPDMTVDVENISEGTRSIESRYDSEINAPYVIAQAVKAERDGFDGIFVSDMDYCGVETAREVIDIPIVGGFRPSAYTAMMLAQRFSIITIVNSVVAMQREHIRKFGISPNFASIRSVHLPVLSLHDKQVALEKIYAESVKAIDEDGANAIIFGCTGFLNVADAVAQRLAEVGRGVPVVDPNRVAISFLELLIRNKLSQSRLTYYKQNYWEKQD
ncbi:MAG: racemase [Okeania sp. SIO2G4]|uniref:aspartate/glutamate racemase family protein n=1 Tax=unclassified Okeania TaxID=2634635 RepID=UPI0013BCB199|nr:MULTISPECIES: aspartate/glutamate racemase family protein [unclassified Okeania]NEP03801.1 racemase [Okeania sp. SIO4D6]NEP76275.1 racemase [Okeania sp. SIO2G5]NEP97354.1 racemase [Okeania sp. SIO2F5]NEQ95086.1 racemase [Okeania sp. SIO2G4]